VNGTDLRWRQRQQLPHRVHLAACQRIERAPRQTAEAQRRGGIELGRCRRRGQHVKAKLTWSERPSENVVPSGLRPLRSA
jgi:hypothetical protein